MYAISSGTFSVLRFRRTVAYKPKHPGCQIRNDLVVCIKSAAWTTITCPSRACGTDQPLPFVLPLHATFTFTLPFVLSSCCYCQAFLLWHASHAYPLWLNTRPSKASDAHTSPYAAQLYIYFYPAMLAGSRESML